MIELEFVEPIGENGQCQVHMVPTPGWSMSNMTEVPKAMSERWCWHSTNLQG